jgi:hypothetical protein
MGFTNKLCNPTPWDVSWNYSGGVFIRIPAFSETELPSIQMVDDFRPDKPGAENVQMNMASLGIFLLDPNKTYDSQALTCIRACIRSQQFQFDDSSKQLRRDMAVTGQKVDDDTMMEIWKQNGLLKTREKIDTLKALEVTYLKAVGEGTVQVLAPEFDPERTIFVLDKPMQFPSVTALEAYLNLPANKEVKKRHEQWKAELTPAAPKAEKKKGAANVQEVAA